MSDSLKNKKLNRKTLERILNYAPGFVILVFSMVALRASLLLMEERSAAMPSQIGSYILKSEYTPEIQLYWSVIILGLSGFILLLLNAHKFWQLSRASEKRKEAQQEKEQLQKQFYQAQKMEAVGRLAGGVAHDFNNILASINGYAEFLMEDLDKETPQHGFASNILKAGSQGRSLVDQMLAFSRVKEDDFEPMDLRESLKECLSMLSASIPKSIEIQERVEVQSAPIRGNTTQISQVIMNLCVNAKDAMEGEKGKIDISLISENIEKHTGSATFSEELPRIDETPFINMETISPTQTRLKLGTLAKQTDYVCLSIEDNGNGMSREILEHIFDPFFTTKAVDKGTGLGLSTVHGVVCAHRGAIIIDTVMGEGTIFRIFFPKIENILIKKEQRQEVSDFEDARILLVEDQEEVADVTLTMLKRIGFKAKHCLSGTEALLEIRENLEDYDLIITDQNMPQMTGIELIFEAHDDFPDLPFVLLSGYSGKKLEALMQQHIAIKAMIRKPVKQKELAKILNSVLRESRIEKTA